jgi:ABC-2 type transport system ATP-binding protein
MSSETLAVAADGVTIRYGRKTAVDDVTLNVPSGNVYALLGRNGAGKSSLVRALLGQLRPDSGAVRLFGDDVWKRRDALMERVGIVPEDADAPPDMRVEAMARFWSSVYALWSASLFDDRLRRFAIAPRTRFGELSKGQKKQVSLALALATSPELLILDDPTLGLDVVARKSLFEEVITELADRGITVLVTTHDLAGVETIADRVAIMKSGRIVLDENLDALKARFRRVRFTARPVVLTNSNLATAAVRSWGSGTEAVVTNYDVLAMERSGAVDVAEVAPMSLEDIFIAVAGEEA